MNSGLWDRDRFPVPHSPGISCKERTWSSVLPGAQTAQAASSYVNNVAAGRAPNTYSPYDSNGNVYSYYNSSYDTGKIPSADSPRVKDVDPGNVYYCEKQESKAEGLEKLLVWHIDSKAELVGYSVLTVSLDLVAYGMAVNGIIVGLAATPETLGGSIVVSTVSMELLSIVGTDLAYDISSITHFASEYEKNGEVEVNRLGFVVPSFILDWISSSKKR